MTDKPTDAVAQARENVIDAMCYDCGHAECERVTDKDRERAARDVDALIAAVRAECAAKVLEAVTHENIVADLPVRGARPEAAEYVADVLLCVRKRIRKTLEEAP